MATERGKSITIFTGKSEARLVEVAKFEQAMRDKGSNLSHGIFELIRDYNERHNYGN